MTEILTLPVEPKSVVWNPTPEAAPPLHRGDAERRMTEFGNVNVGHAAWCRARSGSTYVATDTPEQHSDQTISRAEYERMAKLQNDYIRTRDMLVDRWLHRQRSRVPRAGAADHREGEREHRRRCSSILYYPATPAELENFEPTVTVIYTPNLKAEGYPDERLIAVDLENYITRVFNSDYFGESKKGGLRMWNKIVYERGGLALHAGLQGHPGRRREQGRTHRRPLRHRQDDDDLHEAEQLLSRCRTTSAR